MVGVAVVIGGRNVVMIGGRSSVVMIGGCGCGHDRWVWQCHDRWVGSVVMISGIGRTLHMVATISSLLIFQGQESWMQAIRIALWTKLRQLRRAERVFN